MSIDASQGRNELTERLLASEVSIRFISLADALLCHAQVMGVQSTLDASTVDLNALEVALHAPMLAYLDGQHDLFDLAGVLATSIANASSCLCCRVPLAVRCALSFLAHNNIDLGSSYFLAERQLFDLLAIGSAPQDLAAALRAVKG